MSIHVYVHNVLHCIKDYKVGGKTCIIRVGIILQFTLNEYLLPI